MNFILIILSIVLLIMSIHFYRKRYSPFSYILTFFGSIISFTIGIYAGGPSPINGKPVPCQSGTICQAYPPEPSSLAGGCFGVCCGLTKTVTTNRGGTVTCAYPNFVCPYGTKINGEKKYCLEFDPTAPGNERYFSDCFTSCRDPITKCKKDEEENTNPNLICYIPGPSTPSCILKNYQQISSQYDVQPECNAVSYGGAQDPVDAASANDCVCQPGVTGCTDKSCYFGPSGISNMRFTGKMACMLGSCARSETGNVVTSTTCTQNGNTINVPVPLGGGCGLVYLPSAGSTGLYNKGQCYTTGLTCPVPSFPYIWRNGAIFSLYTEPDHSNSISSQYTKNLDWYCGTTELPVELTTSDVSFLYIDQTGQSKTRFVVTNYNNEDNTFNLFDAATGYYLETYPKTIFGCNQGCSFTCDPDFQYDLLLFRAASKKSRYTIVTISGQNNPLAVQLIDTTYKTDDNSVVFITTDAGGTVKDSILTSTNKSSLYEQIIFYISIEKH